MEDFIISETTKIFSKAIKRFAKKDSVEAESVSILLSLQDEGDERAVKYEICHNGEPTRETKMMEILGVMIDLKGYSLLVPPQIKNIIEGFETEFSSKQIEACVYLNREDDSEIRFFLYNNGAFVKEFFLSDVLKLQIG